MSLDAWTHIGPIRSLADIERLERVTLTERFDTFDIAVWMRRGCEIDPDRTAISFFPDGNPAGAPATTSYRELRGDMTRVANLLQREGIGPQDAVMFMLPNIPAAHVVALASLAAGRACPVNWMLRPEAVLDLVAAAKPRVIVTLGPTAGFEIWERLQSIRDRLPADIRIFSVQGPGSTAMPCDLMIAAAAEPADRLGHAVSRGRDDIVAYIHSGGTTGKPKLVQIASGAMVHKCWAVTVTMGHETSDVIFADMPLFHIAGFLSCVVLPTVLGSQVVIPTISGARDRTFLAHYWEFVERTRITFMHAVPATLSIIAQNPPKGEDVSSLRDYSTTGSTALPVEVARTIERNMGIRIVATYGATEFCQNVTQAPRNGNPKYGSAGIRLPDVEIRILEIGSVGLSGRVCAADEIGRIIVKSPGTTPNYLDPRHGEGVLLGDGWIDNGDLGRLDSDGYLWITGRAKDLIIRSGHNIDPSLIERALNAHPAVVYAAAVGEPDPYAGELPVAYVQLKSGAHAEPEELRDFARATIADPTAVPRRVEILDDMPLTDVRKIDKVVLRGLATQSALHRALAAQIGEGNFEIDLAVDEHTGQRVLIRLSEQDVARADRVTETMNGYAIAWSLV